ncbi:MAG: PKD domain-containing protein [Fibrobacter sp.]|nr:PKD domain-containing protein [Fibrobacter sp.]
MKQKLFTGFSLMALAGVSFWACGEGSINKMDETDNLMAMQYGDHDAWVSFKEEQKDACKADMNCYIQYQGYIDGTELPPEDGVSSSSEEQQQQQQQRLSSAQGTINIDNDGPKSSATIIDPGQTTTSSSSAGTPVTGLGDCKPLSSPIEKGGSVGWQFVGNTALYKPMEFATFTYEWNFGELGTGSGFKTDAITYPASGKYTATVTVTTKDGNTETKVCADTLQVNGAKITCTCTTDFKSPYDYTAGATVTWTATCSSVDANILEDQFTWVGAEGTTNVGSYTFTEPTTVTPKVIARNDDNTESEFDCPPIKGTNGPENEISAPYDKSMVAGVDYTITITSSCPTTVQLNPDQSAGGNCTAVVNGESIAIGWEKQIPVSSLTSPFTLNATCALASIKCW